MALELRPIMRTGDSLVLEPCPVAQPFLSRNHPLAAYAIDPNVEVVVEVDRIARPAVTSLEVAEVKAGDGLPAGLRGELAKSSDGACVRIEVSRLAQRVGRIQRKFDAAVAIDQEVGV